MEINKYTLIISATLGVIVSIVIGFLIGHFTVGTDKNQEEIAKYYRSLVDDVTPEGLNQVIKLVDKEEIKKNLKEMTKNPHQAGTPNDFASADFVRSSFVKYGLDSAELFDYDVLLDYPDDTLYNNIQLLTQTQQVEKTYEIKEDDFNLPSLKAITKSFLAYAKKGSATSDELYYANYCLEDDFEELRKVGIDITDKIVICKYGRVFRGNKVGMAQNYGAKGVLIYDDPINSVPNNQYDYIYPNGEFLPGQGTQRGSSMLGLTGDPLTPLYPATENAYRFDQNNLSSTLPSIQAQVIGYEIAYDLFKLIEHNNNPVSSNDWKGAMNMTYVYGGKLRDQRSLTVNVFNERMLKKTYDVMGFIKGSVEADQYVIIGNHRDAWNLGALDPTSGTATILEMARVLMAMKKNGSWNPKRSVMFMSWGSEEYGLIGSIEWVEEYQKKLSNGVIYVNVDTAVKGNYSFQSAGSPLVKDFLYEITKTIKHSTGETVYDRWVKNDPDSRTKLPSFSPYLGAGSDFMPFAQRVGLPCTDHSFIRDKDHPRFKNVGHSSYPAYHTSYETFELMEQFVDPTFEGFRMLTITMTEVIRHLSEGLLLPFNCVTYAKDLEYEYSNFEKTYQADFEAFQIDLNPLRWAVSNFTKSATEFHKRLDSIDKSKYHLVRAFNEQMRKLEMAFLDMNNPERKGFNHMIYAPSVINSYGSNVFPSITDAIYSYKKNPTSKDLLEYIKQQYAVLIHSIQAGSSVLKDSSDFKRYIY